MMFSNNWETLIRLHGGDRLLDLSIMFKETSEFTAILSRHIVRDLDRSIKFYTKVIGMNLLAVRFFYSRLEHRL